MRLSLSFKSESSIIILILIILILLLQGKFSGEVERLRESVKYEAVKASLREELERRTPSKSAESGKLASILHKVAKSGSSWKSKVLTRIVIRPEILP